MFFLFAVDVYCSDVLILNKLNLSNGDFSKLMDGEGWVVLKKVK